MPSNIELKARVEDTAALEIRLRALSDTPPVVLLQEDTFFHAPGSRLKLRVFPTGQGELISYRRNDLTGLKRSDYHIARVDDPVQLKAVLAEALGIRGVVRKTRTLYMSGATRIHVDRVEGLGTFLELETVLGPGDTDEAGRASAERILRELGIPEHALVAGAYIDLLSPET